MASARSPRPSLAASPIAGTPSRGLRMVPAQIGSRREPVRLVAEASGPDEDEMMALTAREQQQLAEIEHRLTDEEPHLHRACHRHTTRPRRAHARAIARPRHRPRAGIAVVLSVQLAGVAMLAAGDVLGLLALVIPGAIVIAVGPHLACEVMVRRARNELAAVVGPLPTSRPLTGDEPVPRTPECRAPPRIAVGDPGTRSKEIVAMAEQADSAVEVIPAGTAVSRDIPVGTRITAADFGVGAASAEPQEVLVGAGGDPLMIGIPIFVVGSIALGMALIGVIPTDALPAIAPVILAATAFFQLVATFWAILLGQGMVASIFALFSGFWASLAALLLGLTHNWYGTAATQAATHVQLVFFISWDVVFFFLTIVMLRLPAVYPAILVLVLAALTLVILGIVIPAAATTLSLIAGICVLAFCALGLWIFLHIGSVALGGPARPSLGPALVN
jgi:uncharacterized protein